MGMMRREEHYVGRRTMEMEVQVRRGRKEKVDIRDDIREKGLSGEEVYDRDVYRQISTPHQSGT